MTLPDRDRLESELEDLLSEPTDEDVAWVARLNPTS